MESRKILAALAIKYDGNWVSIYDHISQKLNIDESEIEDLLSRNKSGYITILDSNYPDYFKNVYHPPFVLFYEGDLSLLSVERNALGVVGSRHPNKFYKDKTFEAIKELKQDILIVSGLAKGIDGAAHEAALESNKKTIAVIGCGLNVVYPLENEHIYNNIRKKGLIITEYPDNSAPDKLHFPNRNRLIAAIAHKIFVPYALERSGSLITVCYALEMGKAILCFPSGDLNNSACNKLIKEGAILVENAQDIEDYFYQF